MSGRANPIRNPPDLDVSVAESAAKKTRLSQEEEEVQRQALSTIGSSSSSSTSPQNFPLSSRSLPGSVFSFPLTDASLTPRSRAEDDDEKEAPISSSSSSSSGSATRDTASVPPNLTFHKIADAARFRAALEAAKNAGEEEDRRQGTFGTKDSTWYGAFVETHTVEEYERIDTYLTSDSLAGFAIDEDAVISVFKHPSKQKKRILEEMIPQAIQAGGRRLDCFNGFLPKNYSRFGFIPVARMRFDPTQAPKNWNYERDHQPDIIFMIYDEMALPQNTEERETLVKQTIIDLPYSTYEEALGICKARISALSRRRYESF